MKCYSKFWRLIGLGNVASQLHQAPNSESSTLTTSSESQSRIPVQGTDSQAQLKLLDEEFREHMAEGLRVLLNLWANKFVQPWGGGVLVPVRW